MTLLSYYFLCFLGAMNTRGIKQSLWDFLIKVIIFFLLIMSEAKKYSDSLNIIIFHAVYSAQRTKINVRAVRTFIFPYRLTSKLDESESELAYGGFDYCFRER